MKKRTMTGVLLLTMAMGMTACSGGQSQPVSGTVTGQTTQGIVTDQPTQGTAAGQTTQGTVADQPVQGTVTGQTTQGTAVQPAQAEQNTQTAPAPAQQGAAAVQGTTVQPAQGTTTGEITEQQALDIALAQAGLAADALQYQFVQRDLEDGRIVYDVEFMSGGVEYDYEILAADGTVLSFDQDAEYSAQWNTGTGQTTGITGTGQTVGTTGAGQITGTTGGATISAEDAKVIVAGKIPGIDTASIYLSQDYDDGRWVYEGDAYYNQTEYEFEIDAATGQVISWEQESIYD